MQNFIRKVIKASAGTGKTYRLSLEYIGLLLKFAPFKIDFSEILVITFTKKATAEIRERIFEHLRAIIYEDDDELKKNIKALLNIDIGGEEKEILKLYYENMLLNKNKVQISTIDSFTNNIFKTVISPYLGIMNYEVKSSNDEETLSEIYEVLLDQENLTALKDFFFRSGRRSIGKYKNLVESIINKRWLIHLFKEQENDQTKSNIGVDYAEKMLSEFRSNFFEVLEEFQNYLNTEKKNKTAKKVIKPDIFKIVFSEDVPVCHIAEKIREKFEDEEFIFQNSKIIFDKNPFWHGGVVYRKDVEKLQAAVLIDKLNQALENLAEYIFYKYALHEQNEILQIANTILEKYDEIKLREKVFTFNDISYYTFKYLYSPDLSLIDTDNVTNAFYEYLSTSIRFILIDEFQDTSVIQFKILLPIIKEIISGIGVKEYGGVIAVGDEKQSIYGWRDGERDLLLRLPEIVHAEKFELDASYRSEKNIIKFVNQVFAGESLQNRLADKGIDWIYKEVYANKKEDKGYVEVHFRNYSPGKDEENNIRQEEEAIREYIEEIVKPLLLEKKISVASTAILARHNRHLLHIASILDEYGIPYISESSTSILHHRAIKPILYFFRFLVYRDLIDLLRFFRSDFVLMDTDKLQQFLTTYKNSNKKDSFPSDVLEKNKYIAEVAKLFGFVNTMYEPSSQENKTETRHNFDLLNLTKKFIEVYNVTSTFGLENDLKNINLFLEIIAEFKNSRGDNPRSLKDFLDFCEEIDKDENYQQLGLETADALRLMTIHKAKGLEFDNVFLYMNVPGSGLHPSGQVKYYPLYSFDFGSLDNFLMTYNFDYVLPLCKSKYLFEEQRKREEIEILNTFYVAATRPKSNLFIYFTYRKSDGFSKFIKDFEKEQNPPILSSIFYSIYQVCLKNNSWQEVNEYQSYAGMGSLVTISDKTKEQSKTDFSFIKNYFDTNRFKHLKINEKRLQEESKRNFKNDYVINRHIEKGNIVHNYLSFIKFNTEQERCFARSKTIGNYGGLLPVEKIKSLIQQVDKYTAQNPEIFSSEKWDSVFTEHTIFSPDGQEFRVDRMMVNEGTKEVKIIDFKTGEIYDEKQIENYVNILKQLEFVHREGYDVSGDFVEINLSVIE